MLNTSKLVLNKSAYAALIGVFINIILSMVVMPFATDSQISPPDGAAKLPFFSQIMHMLVHHNQVLFTSSLIIFVLVFIATNVALSLKTM